MNTTLNQEVANACLHSVEGVSQLSYSVIPLCDQEVIVGRDAVCSFSIMEPTVSRYHFLLKFENDEWGLYDKSTFGTFLNDYKVQREVRIALTENDVISFGAQEKKFKYLFHATDGTSPPCTRAVIETRDEPGSDSDSDCYIVEVPPSLGRKRRRHQSRAVCSAPGKPQDLELEESIQLIEGTMDQKVKMEEEETQVKEVPEEVLQTEKDRLFAEAIARSDAQEMGRREVKQQVSNFIEEELECSICYELLIEPMVISCYHIFCKWCLSEWKKMLNTICPICRRKISNPKPSPVSGLLDKFVRLLPEEKQFQRMQAVKERTAQVAKQHQRRRSK